MSRLENIGWFAFLLIAVFVVLANAGPVNQIARNESGFLQTWTQVLQGRRTITNY